LVWAGGAAGAVAGIIALAFLIQQWQLTYWNSKWLGMKTRVAELEALQQQIKRFRPWFDESFRSLSILKRLTEAFPEDGAVTAKSVEIREAAVVTCTGTARDHQALLRTLDSLRAMKEIDAVQVEQMRGQVPMQFTFNFRWNPSATP
jgi:Tfp pilus assembly protein PilN